MKIMSATISFRRLRRTLIIWDQDANKDSRNIYWRRASIQDGQASRSTYDATFRNLFFCDNVVIFRRRSKRIAFLESVNFSTRDLMQIVNFRDGHVTTFRHPSNAWSQTLQTSKRHTFRVSAFHRYHLFGVKLFPVGCAEDMLRAFERFARSAARSPWQ